ncbi:MAG TPA: pilus assembly PilX N-terminal domain-containing protein [Verrucomicrobiae bacterium]|nr:pilus assembly PilX N-terminal domain-containing protein [Verrucomicrobiae bacterium]
MGKLNHQAGMALVVGLIMLALMTIMAVASFNIGKVSMEIIGNMQQRSEVLTAANSTIQEAISTRRIVDAPGAVFLTPCAGANTRCFDTNGDGTNDITVALTPNPACIQSQNIPNSTLNFTTIGDSECTVQVDQTQFGIAGGASGGSLCANSLWEVRARASDAVTNANMTVVEGIAVLVGINNVASFCPPAPST